MSSLNKKGLADALLWAIRFIVFAVLVYFVGAAVDNAVAGMTDTAGSEYNVLSERILYSSSGLFYEDSHGRTHIGILDISKFKTETLHNFIEGRRSFAIKLSLRTLDNYKIFDKGTAEIFSDQDKFSELYALSWAEQFGKKSYTEYVLLRDSSGNLHPAILGMEIVFKNEI